LEIVKECPFCSTEINSEALTCPVCARPINQPQEPKTKWYYSNFIVVVAILSFGPLALPLVWFHPHYKRNTKIVVSVVVIVLTVWCFILMKDLYFQIIEQARELGIY